MFLKWLIYVAKQLKTNARKSKKSLNLRARTVSVSAKNRFALTTKYGRVPRKVKNKALSTPPSAPPLPPPSPPPPSLPWRRPGEMVGGPLFSGGLKLATAQKSYAPCLNTAPWQKVDNLPPTFSFHKFLKQNRTD